MKKKVYIIPGYIPVFLWFLTIAYKVIVCMCVCFVGPSDYWDIYIMSSQIKDSLLYSNYLSNIQWH